MEDQLNIYFKKARESLSEPVSIDEVRNKLKDAPAVTAKPSGVPQKLKIFLGLVMLLGGLYFLAALFSPNEETAVAKKAATKEAVVAEAPQHAPLEEAGTIMQESTEERDAPSQSNPPPPKKDAPIEPKQQVEGSMDDNPKNTEAVTDQEMEREKPTPETEPEPVSEPKPEPVAKTEPEAVKPSRSTAPAIRDQPDGESGHRFEILSTSTSRDLKELNKTLSKYGITLHIKAIKYDREWISTMNGHFEDLSTGRKSKFNIGSINFEKLIFTFRYSKSTGPVDMKTTGE